MLIGHFSRIHKKIFGTFSSIDDMVLEHRFSIMAPTLRSRTDGSGFSHFCCGGQLVAMFIASSNEDSCCGPVLEAFVKDSESLSD